MKTCIASVLVCALVATACGRSSSEPAAASAASTVTQAPAVSPAASASATTRATRPAIGAGPAEVGKPAPDFTLKDVEGRSVHLADYRGKTVVLEWFNPGCPFVKASHTKGSLKGTAARHTAKGIVWLAVVSSAPGREGHDVSSVKDAAKRFEMTHPILRDEDGAVGHAYGATNTPHMFVVDPRGTLAYAGAIDNSPDGEGDSPQGGPLMSFVDAAVEDIAAQRPVRTAHTKAYGCSVKYASP
jgi:peroxiredoxin